VWAITTGGNRNDVTQLLPLIGAIPPVRGLRGRPRQRPRHLYADRGYDHETYRDQVRALQITPHIARRGTEHGSELGVYRWVVEGAIAPLHWFRRPRIRWEIRDDIHHAFVTLGCAITGGDRPRSCVDPVAVSLGDPAFQRCGELPHRATPLIALAISGASFS
jgi:hypothetical protein